MPSPENVRLIRKRQRSALQPRDWEARRSTIRKLYMTEDKPLKKVIEIMREESEFDATKAQYENWLAKWRFRKNFSGDDWMFLYCQIQDRKGQDKETSIRLHNTLVPEQKVKAELARHVLPSQEYALTSELPIHEETPEGIFVSTPATTTLHDIRVDNLPWFQFKGFIHSQIEFNQSPELLVDPPRDYWYTSENHSTPFGLNSEYDCERPAGDMTVYASDIYPVTERFLWNLRSIFGPNLPPDAEWSSAYHHLIMVDILPQLEIDIPDFPMEQFRDSWDMLPWSFRTDNILKFLQYAVFLSSNNMLGAEQAVATFEWLVKSGNRSTLDALLSRKLPTVQAYIHNVFKSALGIGRLEIAKTLTETKIDFSGVLESPSGELFNAVGLGDVELTRFILRGGVDVRRCKNIFDFLDSVEIAQLLLKAGADVNCVIQYDERCTTPLSRAVSRAKYDLAEFLIRKGADVNLVRKGIKSPLGAAVEIEDVRFIKLLLDAGAEVDAISCLGERRRNDCTAYGERWATPLQVAAASGNITLAIPLLHAGAKVNAMGEKMNALCWAVRSGSVEMVQLLMDHSADPNAPAKNACRSTAIQIATEQGDAGMVQLLLDAGGTVSSPADLCLLRGQLRQAIRGRCVDKARAILRAGVNVNQPFLDESTMIGEAIKEDDPRMVQLLVNAGVDVNVLCRSEYSPGDMITPLQLALEFTNSRPFTEVTLRPNAVQSVKILLAGGAIPSPSYSSLRLRDPAQAYNLANRPLGAEAFLELPTCNRYNVAPTALRWASRHCGTSADLELLQLLLDYGADVNAYRDDTWGLTTYRNDTWGLTALQIAAGTGNVGLIRFLLKNGADINSPANHYSGSTALQQAVTLIAERSICQTGNLSERAHFEVVELLVKEGADINAPPANIFGRTALQAAAEAKRGDMEIFQYLLAAGADVNAPAGPEGGITALQGAAIQGHIKFAMMLLEKNADVNAPGSRVHGRTAIEGAAEHGRLDMVQLLINAGADSHLPGRQRYRSAAEYAEWRGHSVIVDLLKARFED